MTGQIVITIQRQAGVRYGERALAALALGIGGWFLVPWWVTFAATRGYRAMALVAPEQVWGVLLVALGVLTLAAQRSGVLLARRILNAIGLAVWVAIAIGFLVANPPSIAGPICAWIVSLYAVIFAWQNQEARG